KLTIVPPTSRWYPVLSRYEQQITGRVTGFGGDPGSVLPSPIGDPWGGGGGDGHHHCGPHCHCGHYPTKRVHEKIGRSKKSCKRETYIGKVCRMEFNRCGNFVSFCLLLDKERCGLGDKDEDIEKDFCVDVGEAGNEKLRNLVDCWMRSKCFL